MLGKFAAWQSWGRAWIEAEVPELLGFVPGTSSLRLSAQVSEATWGSRDNRSHHWCDSLWMPAGCSTASVCPPQCCKGIMQWRFSSPQQQTAENFTKRAANLSAPSCTRLLVIPPPCPPPISNHLTFYQGMSWLCLVGLWPVSARLAALQHSEYSEHGWEMQPCPAVGPGHPAVRQQSASCQTWISNSLHKDNYSICAPHIPCLRHTALSVWRNPRQ